MSCHVRTGLIVQCLLLSSLLSPTQGVTLLHKAPASKAWSWPSLLEDDLQSNVDLRKMSKSNSSSPTAFSAVRSYSQQEMEGPSCSLVYLALPVGVAALCIAFLVAGLWRYVSSCGEDSVEGARSVILLPQFVLMMGSTLVVLDSYGIAKKVGMEPGESGQLVGLNWLGSAFGFVTMWASLRMRSRLWLEYPKFICASGLLLHILGGLVYLYGVHTIKAGASGDTSALILRSARVLGGFGQGMVAQLMVVTMVSLTAKADMGNQMTRVFFVNTIGIGAGPILAALGRLLLLCPPSVTSFMVAPLIQVVFGLGALLALLVLFPDLSAWQPAVVTGTQAQEQQEDDPGCGRQRILIISCIILFVMRCFVTSGLEVGSALLLERDYNWDVVLVGLAVGATFWAAFPFKWFHDWLKSKEALTMIGQFRLFACLAILGSLLLFRVVSLLLPGGSAILLADAIIFPSAFLSDGLSYGQLMMNVFPDGSLLDKNHSALWCNMLGMGTGRLFGPWSARLLLESFGRMGQDWYAAGQMLACIVFLVIFEVGVRPGIKS